MIAQDNQAFVNDEDAIFETTKIGTRKRHKTPISNKPQAPNSRQKSVNQNKKITSMGTQSKSKLSQGTSKVSQREMKPSQLSQLIENEHALQSEDQLLSPRRTIYQKKIQEGNQVPLSSQGDPVEQPDKFQNVDKIEKLLEKARVNQESRLSNLSQELLQKNKDLSNLGVFIEKHTDGNASKVYAQVQIKIMDQIGQTKIRASLAMLQQQAQTNIAVRGRGVAAVIQQDNLTERDEKSQPARASQLSIITQSQVDAHPIHVTGTKINESPKRSHLNLSMRSRRDSDLSKTIQQKLTETELKHSERKINQRQNQSLNKYQRITEPNISDHQLAVLYELEEQQIRNQIETQNKTIGEDIPGKMPETRSDDVSPMTVRTNLDKNRQPAEPVTEKDQFEQQQVAQVSLNQNTQLSSYNDIESAKQDLKRQTQTTVQVSTKKQKKESKSPKHEKSQRQWVQHPILLMDGNSLQIPMLTLLDHDEHPNIGMMIEQKMIVPKLTLTKDFSQTNNKIKSHITPSGLQKIMTSRNVMFKERKNTLPLLNNTNKNLETLLYTTERGTQHIDELNQSVGESVQEKNPQNSPSITKTVVFVTKKVQKNQLSPFNQQKAFNAAKEPKRSHSPALLNIVSPQQQMDQQRERSLTHQQSNVKLKSSKNALNDLSPTKIRKSVFTHRKATLDARSKSKLSKLDSIAEPEPKVKIAPTPADIVISARNDLKILLPPPNEVLQELFDADTLIQQQIFRNQILRAPKNISQRLKEMEPQPLPSQDIVTKKNPTINTIEAAADRSAFNLQQELIEQQQKRIAYQSARKPVLREVESISKVACPRSLYFSNKFQPKLSDLREALRTNSIAHHKFNPKFESKDFKQYYKPALDHIQKNQANEEEEQSLLFDILRPRAVKRDKADKHKQQMERLYERQKGRESFQQMRADALTYEVMQKPSNTIEEEEQPAKFVALPNPFVQHLESNGQIESFVLGKQTKEKVKSFLEQKVMLKLPDSLHDAPFDKYQRILQIMGEFNKKRFSSENNMSAIKRMQRDYEELNPHKTKLQKETPKNQKEPRLTEQQIQQAIKAIPSISRVATPEITELRMRPSPDFVPLTERRPKVLKAHRKNSEQLPPPKPFLVKSKEPTFKDVIELYIDYLEGLEIAGNDTDVIQTREELLSEVIHICRQLFKQNLKVQDVDDLRLFLADYERNQTNFQYRSEATTVLLQQASFAKLHQDASKVSLTKLHQNASKASLNLLQRDPSKELILKQRQNINKTRLSEEHQNQLKSELKTDFLSDNQFLGKPIDEHQINKIRQSKEQMRMSKELGRTHDHNLRVSKDEPLQALQTDQALTIMAKMELNTAEQFHEAQDLSLFDPPQQQNLLYADNSVTQIIAAPFINSGGQSTSGHYDRDVSELLNNLSRPILDSQGNLNVNALLLSPSGQNIEGGSSMLRNPSEMQFEIAPSNYFAPSMKDLNNKMKQQKYANLANPKINKSSCNHCIEKKLSEYNADQVSTMFGTDINSSMEALAQQKSKILSQGTSEFMTALRSKTSSAQFEQELIKQLNDPQALKNIQIKQIMKLARRCSDFQQQTLDSELRQAEQIFERMHSENDKWKDAITNFMEQPTEIATLGLHEVYTSNRRDESVQQDILNDIQREKKEIESKILSVLPKTRTTNQDIWKPKLFRVNRELRPYIF